MNNIEGIPEGWELVRFGVPKSGEVVLGPNGEPLEVNCDGVTVWPIIRKIEKPKTYRPFANAAEFKPHRDRWWMLKSDERNQRRSPRDYDDLGYGDLLWGDMLEDANFDDGTPFGVEVTS